MSEHGDEKQGRGRLRLAVDIGGTFTDATLIDAETRAVRRAKVLTTQTDPSQGFLESIKRLLTTPDDYRSVHYIVHATTVATNAIVENKGARTAFVTTAGFRDMFEIARQTRPSLYDLRFLKPRPLVPRHLCFEVTERMDAGGRVLTPLDQTELHRVALQLQASDVEAIAICLLHSYVNPEHERAVGRVLVEVLPNIPVSMSSSVCPEIREYLRASTTVINASVQPIVSRYLSGIEQRLEDVGVSADLLVMQSSGGVYRADSARVNPVYMVESGPAAGVIAATFVGDSLGYSDIVSFDMGGTTAKVGLVQEGRPQVTKEYEVGATAQAVMGEGRGSGYPIRTPVLDLVEIGAGGGSVAWVDSGGSLRVGPQSAGADPGPACYTLGGRMPTVTDANLVLGRLNPQYFLGGEMALNPEAAAEAIERECARPLGLSTVEAALSIVEIANAAMSNAIRLVSVQRGYDPRVFALVAFGGAGPAHANRLAEENEIATTVIPPSPGLMSALGLLATDLEHEYTTPFAQELDSVDAGEMDNALRQLESRGRQELAREGVSRAAMEFRRSVDMRYVGQSYELAVRLREGRFDRDGREALTAQFHDEHDRAYGFKAPGERIETVAVRVTAVGRIVKPTLRVIDGSADLDGANAVKEYRPVYFREAPGFVDCSIYDRYRLGAGTAVRGPAVIEEADSATVIHPGYRATTTDTGCLIIRRADRVCSPGHRSQESEVTLVGAGEEG
jgi:N-methylhydantoinase A